MNRRRNLAAGVAIFLTLTLSGVARPQTQPEQANFPRPVPLGVSFGNIGSVRLFKSASGEVTGVNCEFGTLGALVQDQSGNQYALGAGHAMNAGPTGLLTSGAMVQPSLTDTPYPDGAFAGCYQNPANKIANLTLVVGTPGLKEAQGGRGNSAGNCWRYHQFSVLSRSCGQRSPVAEKETRHTESRKIDGTDHGDHNGRNREVGNARLLQRDPGWH